MKWVEDIARAVDRGANEQLAREASGAPVSKYGARAAAIDGLIADKAERVAKELEQDSDPVALARGTAELSLLMAWRTLTR